MVNFNNEISVAEFCLVNLFGQFMYAGLLFAFDLWKSCVGNSDIDALATVTQFRYILLVKRWSRFEQEGNIGF